MLWGSKCCSEINLCVVELYVELTFSAECDLTNLRFLKKFFILHFFWNVIGYLVRISRIYYIPYNFVKFYIAIIIVKHVESHSMNAIELYFSLKK
jgi:hypothetical protein